MPNPIHEATRQQWDDRSRQWEERGDRCGLWQRCAVDPGLVLIPQELQFLKGIAGKKVCVLGSGDNQVVFALAGLGATVTSVDISEAQLAVARKRAAKLNLCVTFLRADVTDLRELPNDGFDLVYTGGHVAVWVSNLEPYYREAVRILKPGGLFMVNEYHPFRRLWQDSPRLPETGVQLLQPGSP
ncbi:MAG: class I SAM-dependent methyltransferase [Armatimonadota bacterium]|nr:class I SAM-dependent methyltransferase [Armatimonadota bacterium]